MKVLLVSPPQSEKYLVSNLSKGKGFILPYSLLCIASYIKSKGFEVKLFDCPAQSINHKELSKIVKEEKPDVIGLTAFTYTINKAYEAAKTIKEASPETKIILGGIHASVLPLKCLEECEYLDYVAIGEGEYLMKNLLEVMKEKKDIKNVNNLAYRDISGNLQLSERKCEYIDPNELPIPDYDLLDMKLYKPHSGNYRDLPCYSFYTSRGCPFRCSFCSANINMGKKVRHKTIEYCMREIELLINKYGAKSFLIQDSTFTVDKEWVKEFCNELIKRKFKLSLRANTRADCIDLETLKLMKKAGFYRINIGFESGNQDSLKLVNKGTTVEQNIYAAKIAKKSGLQIGASFIIGLPNESMGHVKKTIKFALKLKAKHAQFYLPIPYPGTKLREQCKEGLREDVKWEDYGSRDFSKAVYINNNFDPKVFRNLPNLAFRKFYLNPRTLLRLIFTIGSIHEFKDTVQIFKAIIKKTILRKKL